MRKAHATGLIHRDVKPSNIFAARRGEIDDVAKLLDFGLVLPAAKERAARHDEMRTGSSARRYSCLRSRRWAMRELDERSDIYSLGAVAYYLLTGRPPFDRGGSVGVMIAHAREPLVPPSSVRTGIPEDLERVVLRCLAKAPADRFPDAASVERALAVCACAADWEEDRAALWSARRRPTDGRVAREIVKAGPFRADPVPVDDSVRVVGSESNTEASS